MEAAVLFETSMMQRFWQIRVCLINKKYVSGVTDAEG
jgi:hypothetical protein